MPGLVLRSCHWRRWIAASGRANAGAPVVNAVSFYNHVPGGANVLYMDGRVEFVRYNAKAPITTKGVDRELKTQAGIWMYRAGGYG